MRSGGGARELARERDSTTAWLTHQGAPALLATRLPTAHEQGAFVDRFVGGVLPAVIDGTEFATLRALGEPIANDPMPVAPSGVTR